MQSIIQPNIIFVIHSYAQDQKYFCQYLYFIDKAQRWILWRYMKLSHSEDFDLLNKKSEKLFKMFKGQQTKDKSIDKVALEKEIKKVISEYMSEAKTEDKHEILNCFIVETIRLIQSLDNLDDIDQESRKNAVKICTELKANKKELETVKSERPLQVKVQQCCRDDCSIM